MRVVCAWCKMSISEEEGASEGVSHGICRMCAEKEMTRVREIRQLKNAAVFCRGAVSYRAEEVMALRA